MRIPLALLLALSLAACDSGGGDDDDDVAAADAAPTAPDAAPASGNALGRTCTASEPCPTEPAHTCVYLNSGNPDVGYCSPVCGGDPDCTDGYTGPGDPTCFTPDDPNACTILCDTPADCPTGLTCVATGGPVSVCATI